MSDIDLKALRETCDSCVASDRLMPVANAWQVLAVFDRLESAERRAEEAEKECAEQACMVGMGAERELALMAKLAEAEKERDALQEVVDMYEWLRDVHIGEDPESINLDRARQGGLDAAIKAAMAQEGGK